MLGGFRSRLVGCFLGGALGDALGYPIEFLTGVEVPSGPPPSDLPVGLAGYALISDDTQMTLFTADGIIRCFHRTRDWHNSLMTMFVWSAYQRWLRTQDGIGAAPTDGSLLMRATALYARRAPGNTCLSALQEHRSATDIPSVANPANDSKGCGALMRSAPIGLLPASADEVFAFARDCGAITHGHPSGYLSAAAFAVMIHEVLYGKRMTDAIDVALSILVREPQHDETSNAIRRGVALGQDGLPCRHNIESLGGGWTGEEALAIAIACAISAVGTRDGIAEALWRSVTHDGDSDSTGSVTGNLLGVAYGKEQLPAAWLADLELATVIETVAEDLWRVAHDGQTVDGDNYPPY